MSLAGVVFWEHRDTARPAAAIVVLGAAQYVGRPSPVLRARLDHAIDLWRRGLAPRIIFTGGFGDHDTTSEAAVGQRYAIERGVPPRAILIENSGPIDRGSRCSRSPTLMEAEPSREVILVSDPFHMLRLSILARRFGLTPLYLADSDEPDFVEHARGTGSTCSASRSRCRSRSCSSGASSGAVDLRARTARTSHVQ